MLVKYINDAYDTGKIIKVAQVPVVNFGGGFDSSASLTLSQLHRELNTKLAEYAGKL